MTGFWGDWADFLSEQLAGVAPGDALLMSESVYSTLCATQRAIERAANVSPTYLPVRIGGPSPWDPADEELLVAVAQSFQAGLVTDEWDPGPGHHTGHVAGWIMTGVGPPPHPEPGSLRKLIGTTLPQVGGLLGRVRSSLGS